MNGDGLLDRVYRNCKHPDWSDPCHVRFCSSPYPVDTLLTKIKFAGCELQVEAVKLAATATYLVDGSVATAAGKQPGGQGGRDWFR